MIYDAWCAAQAHLATSLGIKSTLGWPGSVEPLNEPTLNTHSNPLVVGENIFLHCLSLFEIVDLPLVTG